MTYEFPAYLILINIVIIRHFCVKVIKVIAVVFLTRMSKTYC